MAKNNQIQLKTQPVKGKDEAEGAVLLTRQGEVTIENAVAGKKCMTDNLAKPEKFSVKVSNVENIDLTIVQLLQRFFWDVKELGKEVEFEFRLTEEFQSLLQRAGFQSFLALSKHK